MKVNFKIKFYLSLIVLFCNSILLPIGVKSQEVLSRINHCDTTYCSQQVLVSSALLKNVDREVEEFVVYDNVLYYISSNGEAIFRYNIKNRESSIIGTRAKSLKYTYRTLNVNKDGVVTVSGIEPSGFRVYNIVGDNVLALLSIERGATLNCCATTIENMVVATSNFKEGPVKIKKCSGEFIDNSIEYPIHPLRYSSRVKYMAFAPPKLTSNIDLNRFAVLFGNGLATLKIFDVKKNSVSNVVESIVDTIQADMPFRLVGRDTLLLDYLVEKKRRCAIDIVSNDKIFVLYNSHSSGTIAKANMGDTILEFDWSGNLLRCHKLTNSLNRILYDYATNKFYGIVFPSSRNIFHLMYEITLLNVE